MDALTILLVIGSLLVLYYFFKFLFSSKEPSKLERELELVKLAAKNMEDLKTKKTDDLIEFNPLLEKKIDKLKSINHNLRLMYFDFSYNYLYPNLYKKSDSSYRAFSSYEYKDASFIQLILYYFQSNSMECAFNEDLEVIEFKNQNRSLLIKTSDYVDWQYDFFIYQYFFYYDKDEDSLIPKVHSIVVFQNSNNTVCDIIVIEYPTFGNEPVIRKLKQDGHDLLSIDIQKESFTIEDCNIGNIDESFILALIQRIMRN